MNYISIHEDVPKGRGRNGEPPIAIWHNIAPTLIVLDEIREQLGLGITIKNTYRFAEYNEASYIRSKGRRVDKARKDGKVLSFKKAKSGVARLSQHMAFRALDFGVNSGGLNKAFTIAKSLRGEKFNLPIPLRMDDTRIKKMKYVGGSKPFFNLRGLQMTEDSFIFRGGVALYKGFVHIDCRGKDKNWG